MLPGLNPKKMQAMMKQLGMKTEDINAEEVIIKKTDKTEIKISNPQVTKINMQGQETFQIAGDIEENESEKGFSIEDIEMIIEKTGKSKEEVRESLQKTKDIAETILELSKSKSPCVLPHN